MDTDIITVLIRDSNGRMPLELAADRHSVEIRDFLAEKQDEAVRLIRDTLQGVGVFSGFGSVDGMLLYAA